RDHLLVDEHAVALEVELRVLQRGHVAGQLSFRLLQLRLKGAGVDLGEQLALAHELALAEVHFEQLAVRAAAHGDGVERGDGAQRAEGDGEIARAGDGGDDGGGARPRSRRGASTAPARLPFAGASYGLAAAVQ